MKKLTLSTILAILLITACEKKAEMAAEEVAYSEEAVLQPTTVDESETSNLDSKALNKTPNDKKFKKEININLEVKNAYKSTLFIEDVIIDFGRYILKSKLENNIESEKSITISNDSIKKYVKINVVDSIICKVPQEKVSQFLRNLDGKYTRLNSRAINLEDVNEEYVLGESSNKSSSNHSNKIEKALNTGSKLGDKVKAIGAQKNYEDERNNNQFYQAKLSNDVKFSTVEISLT